MAESEYRIQGSTLAGIADAIRGKTGGTSGIRVSQMAAQIGSISAGQTQYVIGSPVSCTLLAASWNGSTYDLRPSGYKIGDNGVQIGLPDDSTGENAVAVIEAALSIGRTGNFKDKDTKAITGCYIDISAVTPPTVDVVVGIFGLEAL